MKHFFARLKYGLKERVGKRELIVGAVILIILLGCGIALGLSKPAMAPHSPPPKPKPKPVAIVSPLTGLPVTAAQAKMPITGVMIENSDFARPQSGLSSAGVVFEAIAEAGITRFLALYQTESPSTSLGPVRSLRPYFLNWAMGFQASIAHVGGSPEALTDIKNWGGRDIGEFGYGGYYHRISSRFAPHNMYTSLGNLEKINKVKSYTTSEFTPFVRKKAAPAKTPTAATINFNVSYPDFAVKYVYNQAQNTYTRYMAGVKHIDANTGKVIAPNVVIGIVVPYGIESDNYHSRYGVIGSGAAYIFQDGTVTKGTWSKSSHSSNITFTDAAGKPIALDPGQTWITALASASRISYKP